MNKKLKQQRAARQRAKLRKKGSGPGGPPLPTGLSAGLALGFAVLGALYKAFEPEEPAEGSAKQLPPAADDLTLNPETGDYELKKPL